MEGVESWRVGWFGRGARRQAAGNRFLMLSLRLWPDSKAPLQVCLRSTLGQCGMSCAQLDVPTVRTQVTSSISGKPATDAGHSLSLGTSTTTDVLTLTSVMPFSSASCFPSGSAQTLALKTRAKEPRNPKQPWTQEHQAVSRRRPSPEILKHQDPDLKTPNH